MIIDDLGRRRTGSCQTYVPILPKHIWGDKDYVDDRRRPVRRAGRRHRPVPGRRMEDRRVRPVRPEPATTGATRAPRTRSSSSSSGRRTRWSRPSAPARSTTPAAITADQFDPLKSTSRIIAVERHAPTAGPSSASTPTARDRQDDRGRRAVDEGAPGSGSSVTRSATRSTRRSSSSASSAATATSGTTKVPPALAGSGTRSRRHRADVRHRARQAEARGRRLRARRRRQAARQGRQADQPAAGHARLGRHLPDDRASSSPTGGVSSGSRSRHRSYDEGTLVDMMLPPEAGGAGQQGRLRPVHLGLGRGADPNSLLEIFTVRRDRRLVRQHVLQRAIRRALRAQQQSRAAARRARRSSTRCRSSSTTRRRTTSCTTTPTCTPTAPTSSRAGRTSRPNGTPLFAYGTLGYTLLQPVGRRQRRSRPPSRADRRCAAPHRRPPADRRRQPASDSTPTPARRRSRSSRSSSVGLVLVASPSRRAEDDECAAARPPRHDDRPDGGPPALRPPGLTGRPRDGLALPRPAHRPGDRDDRRSSSCSTSCCSG